MKSLRSGGLARHYKHEGRENWPLPKDDMPGAWRSAAPGTMKAHSNGFHLARLPLEGILWSDEENYIAEIPYEDIQKAQRDGNLVIEDDCIIARDVRLLEKIELNDESWQTLAFRLAQPALRMPEYMGFPHEYSPNLSNLYFYLRGGQAPLAYRQDLNGFISGVDTIINRCEKDGSHTLRYNDCCEAVYEAALAVRHLLAFSPEYKTTQPASAIARKVAYGVRKSMRSAGLAYEMADTSFTSAAFKRILNHEPPDMPERYKQSAPHRAKFNIMRQQNNLFLEEIGRPDLQQTYDLVSRFKTNMPSP